MSKSKKNDSVWQKILKSVLKEKISTQGNIVVLGDPNCGKKSLISGFKKMIKQENKPPVKIQAFYNNLYKSHGLSGKQISENSK